MKELRFLLSFNVQVAVSLKKSIRNVSDTVFLALTNAILLRKDAYPDNLWLGVKKDTAVALRHCLSTPSLLI